MIKKNYLTGRGWNEIIHQALMHKTCNRKVLIKITAVVLHNSQDGFAVKGAEIVLKFVIL